MLFISLVELIRLFLSFSTKLLHQTENCFLRNIYEEIFCCLKINVVTMLEFHSLKSLYQIYIKYMYIRFENTLSDISDINNIYK